MKDQYIGQSIETQSGPRVPESEGRTPTWSTVADPQTSEEGGMKHEI